MEEKGPETVRWLRPVRAMLILIAACLSGGLALPADAHTDHAHEAMRRQVQSACLSENARISDAEHRSTNSKRLVEVCAYLVSGARRAVDAGNALVVFARNSAPCLDCCRYGPCPPCQGFCGIGGACASSCAAGHGALIALGPAQLDLSRDRRSELGLVGITGGRDPSPELKPPRL